MINKEDRKYIRPSVNQWTKYIEIFTSSTIRITDLEKKGLSWEAINNIFIEAIKNKEEINLNKL